MAWGQGYTYTTMMHVYADLQKYICETGVDIQVSDSPPPYCITVCSVQEPHFLSVGLFQHLKAVRIFFVVGDF